MEDETNYASAQRRYARIHQRLSIALFALAALGAIAVPVEPAWRIGYAVGATIVVLAGIFLSRWWVLQKLRDFDRGSGGYREQEEDN